MNLPVSGPVLQASGLCKRFGGLVATDHVDLDVAAGEVHAIIGPNGAGKTTLIAQLSGELRPDEGRIRFLGEDVTALPTHARAGRGLARSYQITSIFPDFTALQNAAFAVQGRAGHSFRFWKPAETDEALLAPARRALEKVGLAHRAGIPASSLSYGEKRALELATALAGAPKLLLMDEPLAGMGPEDAHRTIEMLRALRGQVTIVLIEHDINAVFALADRISVLVYGKVIACGPPEAIRDDPAVQQAYLGEGDAFDA